MSSGSTEALGRAVLTEMADQHFEKVLARFAPKTRRRLSVDGLRQAWVDHVERFGPIEGFDFVGSAGGNLRFAIQTARRPLDATVSFDEVGRLTNIQVVPSPQGWTPAEYADATRFTEKEVRVSSGEGALAGALTLPVEGSDVPAVVLLPGGGPFDRDMTVGLNRIGKDLAWGLSSAGIAVIRLDKPASAAGSPAMVPSREYSTMARAALEELRSTLGIDHRRLFVVGHSMGARYAPLVIRDLPEFAGAVMLAADSQPLEKSAVRVADYLAALPYPPAGASQMARRMRRQARRVGRNLSPRTRASGLPFGFDAEWWADVKGYDPVATANQLDVPLLLVQGRRDYQVTVADDLAVWRQGLQDRSNIDIEILDEDDHFFFRGTGASTPRDYEAEQHLDARVVERIAAWIGGFPAS